MVKGRDVVGDTILLSTMLYRGGDSLRQDRTNGDSNGGDSNGNSDSNAMAAVTNMTAAGDGTVDRTAPATMTATHQR